ncbi:MAG: molybdopterin synthase sulfur carrier subunit [Chloroflexi bacterium]|nr:MAG: molybdopterin synthase sulfur carrier subunit [Chloroflexota bacterium]
MLRQYRPETAGGAPHHPFSVVIDAPAVVKDVLVQLKLPDDLVMVTAVNEQTIDDFETPLQAGDIVSFFPPVAGGAHRLSEKFVSKRPFSLKSQV